MHEMPKAYVAAAHEAAIYQRWLSAGAFAPSKNQDLPPFTLVAPPPNANGNLHMGHALEITIMDVLTRYHRMRGYRATWIPGADHAGIETQVVYEKHLEKDGRSRFQMERKQFYDEVAAFTQANRGNMESQLRMLGASCDWDVNTFTLDDKVVDEVYETFRKLYADGLIYRGERIVNYSVKYQTAYSDLEVVHEDRNDPLYFITYGPITIATVRPETKFGEKYIVVHPEDARYQQYIGTTFKAQIATGEFLDMTVIADEAIKPEFGTGAMTITPAHDPIDFEIAQRHNLPIIPIIGLDGKLLPIAGEFAGMKVAAARTAIAARLQELGLIEKIDTSYRHSVALCYKSNQPIEPMVMPQWFVKVRPLAKIQLDWLRNLRDWNISRQIWWGIPIKGALPEDPTVANDPDTFDTWFSSGQWPYITAKLAGAQYGNQDLYPTTVMQTGRDLIFLWVTRMLMLGLYRTGTFTDGVVTGGQVPFKDVYFHGMILDSKGKKMSKSKGNVVSPVELVAKYGADAVRFGLLIGSSAGSDIPMPEEKMVGGRNFANKLWNMARFVQMQVGEQWKFSTDMPQAKTEADTAILQGLTDLENSLKGHIPAYRLAQALQELHEFAWHSFADVYIEQAKQQRAEGSETVDASTAAVLTHVLTRILALAHPFMPFVTEVLWEQLQCPGVLATHQL
jgi:valyl-tRNA synthetase